MPRNHKKILVVEDEKDLADLITYNLERNGYDAVSAGDGQTALDLAIKHLPDLVLLDLMLPGLDGTEVARKLKSDSRTSHIPVIMLTAKGEETDVVVGLTIGADDYVTKPFSPRELVARVQAVLRRTRGGSSADVIRIADVVVDIPRLKVTRDNKSIELTTTEFQLLSAMARHPGRVFTRAQLLDAVRGVEVDAFERAIDAHIKNIRRKLERDSRKPRYVLTVYGVGYKFAEA